MSGSVGRKVPYWIESFEAFTEGFPSPPIFRKWCAISAISGALERRVWVRTLGSNLYPNTYIILVGPPGVGKTAVTSQVEKLWRGLDEVQDPFYTAPTSVTKAALMDALCEAKRKLVMPPQFIEFNSIAVNAGELGVFMPQYENEFMNTLTGLWDCHPYVERRRGKDIKFAIDSPSLTLLAATTPSYLNAFMPEGAWDQGFISRTLLVYSGGSKRVSLFAEPATNEAHFRELQNDLKLIKKYYGKISFDEDAAKRIGEWHLSGGEPAPTHPRLVHYLTRRTAHALKLCMVAAASRADFAYQINLGDVELALDWLFEIEHYMEDIFKAMNSGGDSTVMDEVWHHTFKLWASNGRKPIPESNIVGYLRTKVPSHSVLRVLEIMEREGRLKPTLTAAGKMYLPTPKEYH